MTGDDTIPRYSVDDDLEEAAERLSRELPEQIERLRGHVKEARRKITEASERVERTRMPDA